jgi:shikimate dehydrogenase
MNETTRHVVGSLGADIGPSQSPSLHEREADELGLRYVYERIDITRRRRDREQRDAYC